MLGGGKFANGAVSAAFVHMYNAMGHPRTILALTPAQQRAMYARMQEPGLLDATDLFIPLGRLIGNIYRVIGEAIGPLGNWLRVGNSFSKTSGFQTKAIRWGGNRHYREQIGSTTLRNLNESLHNTRIPIKSWRTQDAGHLHLYRR